MGPSGDLDNHQGWSLDTERIIRQTVSRFKEHNRMFAGLEGRYTYAIRCAIDKPNKRMGDCCSPLFHRELLKHAPQHRPIAVLALGPAVLRSLGVKYGKYKEVQGKFLEVQVQGRRVFIYPSLSKRQLAAKSGYVNVLERHVENFIHGTYALSKGEIVQTVVPMEQIVESYIFPSSPKEVRELVEFIINYAPPGKDPRHVLLSLDTETNTLHPHRQKLKLLSVVASWEEGQACSIPYEHPETPWKPEAVRPYIAELVTCSKPKVGHNIKYDLKVFERKGFYIRRISWDTMIGEHLLEEDKKGYYSLKDVTKLMLPKYAGYEDQLHDILNMLEAPTQVQQLKNEADGVKPTIPKSKLRGAAKKLAEDDGFLYVPLKQLNEYGAIDGDVTRQIAIIQMRRMAEENKRLYKKRNELWKTKNKYMRAIARPGVKDPNPLRQLMIKRGIPATRALARMEATGIRADHDYIDELIIDMDQSLRQSRQILNEMIPPKVLKDPFNPGSTAHLRKILFASGYLHPETQEAICYRGRVEPIYTSTGLESTNQAFLRSLVTQFECPFAKAVLKFRATSKARNTFVANVQTLSMEDGRMHTSFHIAGTSTGRLSSSDENMQNVPVRIGKHNLKKMFIPTDPETEVIVNADAKAAEVRIYAAYSRDPNLIKALNDGMDPHSFFASMVYNPATVLQDVEPIMRKAVMETVGIDDEHAWSYEDFQKRDYYKGTPENPGPDPEYGKRLGKLRKTIKRVVFGILYGASPRKVSYIVGIPQEQADVIIDTLFKMFPTIKHYIRLTKDQVRHLETVETFLGRRRRFNLKGLIFHLRNKAERQAVNFKIQSTSSDVVLGVLCELMDPLEQDFHGRMLITVHDSVVFEIPKQYISQVPDFIEEYGVKRVGEQYPWMPVPFKWDVEVGPSYGELASVESYLSENPEYRLGDEDEHIEQDIRSEFQQLVTV